MTERDSLLDELSAKVLAHMDLAGSIADIRVQVAQSGTKLDQITLSTAAMLGEIPDLKARVERIENNWKWIIAIVGMAWAVILAAVSAYIFKLVNNP